MTNRIKHIDESSCEFVESLDTTYPGLIELSRKLYAEANKMVTSFNDGEADAILTGEMLLLAGYSSLLASRGCQPTNFALHLDGLVLQGNPLPTQSIYIAMKDVQPTIKKSPRKTLSDAEGIAEVSDKEIQEEAEQVRQATIEGMEDAINYSQIQAELDAEVPQEVLDTVKEYRTGASRFYDQPSTADKPFPASLGSPVSNPSASLYLPATPSGIHGGRD